MGRKTKEIPIGARFGPFTVLVRGGADKHGRRWLCSCDYCDETRTLTGTQLRSGKLKSCGCLWIAASSAAKITHGEAGYEYLTVEYKTWVQMIGRCENPNLERYPQYGGRGISVCARWRHSYETFLADMGRRPSDKCSIDRIDNDGNYEPGNCRWATRREQQNNTSTTRYITFRGQTAPVTTWASRLGVTAASIRQRLNKGWSVDRTLTEPINLSKRNRRARAL